MTTQNLKQILNVNEFNKVVAFYEPDRLDDATQKHFDSLNYTKELQDEIRKICARGTRQQQNSTINEWLPKYKDMISKCVDSNIEPKVCARMCYIRSHKESPYTKHLNKNLDTNFFTLKKEALHYFEELRKRKEENKEFNKKIEEFMKNEKVTSSFNNSSKVTSLSYGDKWFQDYKDNFKEFWYNKIVKLRLKLKKLNNIDFVIYCIDKENTNFSKWAKLCYEYGSDVGCPPIKLEWWIRGKSPSLELLIELENLIDCPCNIHTDTFIFSATNCDFDEWYDRLVKVDSYLEKSSKVTAFKSIEKVGENGTVYSFEKLTLKEAVDLLKSISLLDEYFNDDDEDFKDKFGVSKKDADLSDINWDDDIVIYIKYNNGKDWYSIDYPKLRDLKLTGIKNITIEWHNGVTSYYGKDCRIEKFDEDDEDSAYVVKCGAMKKFKYKSNVVNASSKKEAIRIISCAIKSGILSNKVTAGLIWGVEGIERIAKYGEVLFYVVNGTRYGVKPVRGSKHDIDWYYTQLKNGMKADKGYSVGLTQYLNTWIRKKELQIVFKGKVS